MEQFKYNKKLVSLLEDQNMGYSEAARILRVDRSTVLRWCKFERVMDYLPYQGAKFIFSNL